MEHFRRNQAILGHMLTVVLLAGVADGSCTHVPGTGPIYAFGQDFPWKNVPYEDLSTFVRQKMSLPTTIPRNAMPSLHVAWDVHVWWNSKRFPIALRAAVFLFLFMTVIATLGSGQHYLVDLVVSLPFALTVQSAASYAFPGQSHANKSRRLTAVALLNPNCRAICWFIFPAALSKTIRTRPTQSRGKRTGTGHAFQLRTLLRAGNPTPLSVHFTPTYASWLNQVEIWFNRITQRAIRRGTFRSVKELVTKIDQFVENDNQNAQPFVWTATADSIFAKVQRLCERISGTGH